MLERDALRIDVQLSRQPALQPDGHIAQADRSRPGVEQRLRHDTDRVCEIDDPGSGSRASRRLLGNLEDHRHGPEGLGEAARPGRLLTDDPELVRQRLVHVASRLTAHPELENDEIGPLESRRAIGSGQELARPTDAIEHSTGEPGHRSEPLEVGVEKHELVHGQAIHPPCEALHELRRVRAAAAYDGDLHAHDSTSKTRGRSRRSLRMN